MSISRVSIVGGLIAVCGALLVVANREAVASSLTTWRHQRAIEAAVRAQLKDPDSAQFAALRVGAVANTYCGTVNAKNGMGGYEGPRGYVAFLQEGAVTDVLFDGAIAHPQSDGALGLRGCGLASRE